MGKLVIAQGSKNDTRARSGANGSTPLGGLKLGYAVAAVVIALGCLCAAILHFRGVGGDNELSLSQARNQMSRKRPFASSTGHQG